MMRISIWQQWASNHSASFTVVGVFESVEAAQKAADTLQNILATIAEWYERPENTSLHAQWEAGEELPPSPPEIDFSKEYGVEWNEHSIDWIRSHSMAEEAVSTLGNCVFVTSVIRETWLGPKPFDTLTEKLGGQATVTGEGGDIKLSAAISCTAPDESTAQSIYGECSTYFSNHHRQRTPWKSYVGQSTIDLPTGETIEVSTEERIEAEDWCRALFWAQQDAMQRIATDPRFLALQAELQKAGQQQDHQHLNELAQEYHRLQIEIPEIAAMQQAVHGNDLVSKRRYLIGSFDMHADFNFTAHEGNISQKGLGLEFTNVAFLHIQYGLPALLEYLKSKGCTGIKHTLEMSHGDE